MTRGIITKLSLCLFFFGSLPVLAAAQPGESLPSFRDCSGALLLCADTTLQILGGSGQNDFADPDNDAGCLAFGERNSIWFYLQFADDLPASSSFEMLLEPVGASLADYNLAVFGPHIQCDSLGTSIRCTNFSSPGSATGLRAGETDFFEDASGGNGFVAPLTPQPGEGYYILIDYLNNFGVEGSFAVRLSGSAAPHLQCGVMPGCSGFRLFYPEQALVCDTGEQINIAPKAGSRLHWDEVTWTSSDGGLAFLRDAGSIDPLFEALPMFSGSANFRVTARTGQCREETGMLVRKAKFEGEILAGDTIACRGTEVVLTAADSGMAYRWSTGQTGASVITATPGTYGVTFTDAFGCERSDSLQLTFLAPPDPSIAADTILCRGETAILAAVDPTLIYNWSNGVTGRSIAVDRGGRFGLTVTDNRGCRATDSVLVRESTQVPPAISGPELFCRGTEILLQAPAGYRSYAWSDGSTAPDIDITLPGEYLLTVNDELGCRDTATLRTGWFDQEPLRLPDRLTFCAGEELNLQPVASYESYNWSDGSDGSALVVRRPGAYALTVEDANGCRQDTAFQVTMLSVPDFQLTGPDYFCSGDTIELRAEGTADAWIWADGSTGAVRTVTAAGDYRVVARDDNGCSRTESRIVREERLPKPVIEGPNRFCAGDSVRIAVRDTFRTYRWSDGNSEAARWVSLSGTYRLVVENDFDCQSTVEAVVMKADLPEVNIDGPDEFCDGTRVSLTATGSTADYLWSTGNTGATIEVAAAGTYQVSATDQFGCSRVATHEAIGLPRPLLEISGPRHICSGETIRLEANPGLQEYLWSTGNRERQQAVTTGGNYRLVGIADSGCADTLSVEVSESPPPIFTLVGEEVLCEGDVQVLRTEPLFAEALWPDGSVGPEWTITTPGSYSAVVTDEFGCSSTRALEVQAVPTPEISLDDTTAINCREASVTLLPQFSLPEDELSYEWSGPGIDSVNREVPDPMVTEPGTYSLNARDKRYGCPAKTVSIYVHDLSAPPEIALDFSGVLDCRTDSVVVDGSGSASGAGITYRWLNAEENLLNSDGVPVRTFFTEGTYYFEVADTSRNCAARQEIFLDGDYAPPLVDAGPPATLYCTPASTRLDGSNSFGHRDLAYRWYSPEGHQIEDPALIRPLVNAPGYYYLEIQDLSNGCIGLDSVLVRDGRREVQFSLADTFFLACNPYQVSLGTDLGTDQGYAFEWYYEDSTLLATGAEAIARRPGEYRVIVTEEASGCESEGGTHVREGEEIPGQYELEVDAPTCDEQADGRVTIRNIRGGTGPYLIDFAERGFVPDAAYDRLPAGTYPLVVRDALGCEHRSQIVLDNQYELRLDIGGRLEIQLGEEVLLEAGINRPLDSLVRLDWKSGGEVQCVFCPDIPLQPLRNQHWVAEAVDVNGCRARDEVRIVVKRPYEVHLPSAFSPNQDGNNDELSIYIGPDLVRINFFRIFDRWGNLVHALPGTDISGPAQLSLWDGRSSSREYPMAVYVYQLEAEFIDGTIRQFAGDVLLSR